MPGLDTRTGRRNVQRQEYVPKISANPVKQNQFRGSQIRSDQPQASQPYKQQFNQGDLMLSFMQAFQGQRASTPNSPQNAAQTNQGINQESARDLNQSQNLADYQIGQMKTDMMQIGAYSAGLQRQGDYSRSQNSIAENAASSAQQRLTNQQANDFAGKPNGKDYFNLMVAQQERASQSDDAAANRAFVASQNSMQRQVDQNNATKQYAAAAANADAQIRAAEAAANANRYAAAQQSRAGVISSMFGSLNNAQGWRYW